MKISRIASTLVAAAMGAVIIAPIQPLTANATSALAQNNTLSVSSGSLIIFASASQTFTNTGVALSTTVSSGTAKTFFVNNSGSIGITAFAFIVTLPNNANVTSFKRCAINVAFTGTNTCATGTPVNVTITPGVSTSYVLSLPSNSFYSYQIVQNKSGTMVVNTYANISHAVTGTTNS
jgi:hypothetical protein